MVFRFCPLCGERNAKGRRECERCGSSPEPFTGASSDPSAASSTKATWVIAWFSVIGVAVTALIFLYGEVEAAREREQEAVEEAQRRVEETRAKEAEAERWKAEYETQLAALRVDKSRLELAANRNEEQRRRWATDRERWRQEQARLKREETRRDEEIRGLRRTIAIKTAERADARAREREDKQRRLRADEAVRRATVCLGNKDLAGARRAYLEARANGAAVGRELDRVQASINELREAWFRRPIKDTWNPLFRGRFFYGWTKEGSQTTDLEKNKKQHAASARDKAANLLFKTYVATQLGLDGKAHTATHSRVRRALHASLTNLSFTKHRAEGHQHPDQFEWFLYFRVQTTREKLLRAAGFATRDAMVEALRKAGAKGIPP